MRRVRIACLIGFLMVNPVRRHPEHRAAFQRHRGANRQEVLDESGKFIGTVRVQAMVAKANAQPGGGPI